MCLVNELSVEGNAHSAQKESSILVGSGGCVDGDVATGNHLGRVPIAKKRVRYCDRINGLCILLSMTHMS